MSCISIQCPMTQKKLFPFCSGTIPYCTTEEKTLCLYTPFSLIVID